MVLTRQAAEVKLTAMRARLYKKAANGSRYVFYVPSTKRYIAIDGLGDGRIAWSEHASCPACK